METTKLCPYCKEEIKVDALKCRHCGSMLQTGTVVTAVDQTTAIRVALGAKYEILSEIGRGGMAVVYKAIQRNLERVVALKALPPHLTQDDEFLERFHREARSAAKLSHPNIIIVHDEGIEEGVHYIAMEYLEGIDLNRLIKERGRLSPEETIEYIAPIASALEYAHSKGLVHRDVKSSNIFIAEPRRPVLTDFGIAHAAAGTHLTMSGTILGTPDFMSPEQASGKPVDGRSDIYGLGVVLYHALTGRLPFKSDSALTTIYRVMSETYIPVQQISSVPAWLEIVVNRCLEKDPEHRIQTGGELAQALRARRTPSILVSPDAETTMQVSAKEFQEALAKPSLTVAKRTAARSSAPARGVKPTPVRRHRSPLWLYIGLTLLVLAAAGYFLYRADVFGPKPITVPQIAGLSWQEARTQLEKKGLKPLLAGGPATGKNRVSDQNPMPGEKIKPGSTVNVYTEKVVVLVPSLIGMSADQAVAALKTAGLVMGSTIERPGPPEEQGKIVQQIPEAGTAADDGSSVSVIVGI